MILTYCYAILIWNIVVMFIYGIDKMLAKMRKRRISEAALIGCALLMGGFGSMFGMVLFNHKTSKMKFRILVPLALVVEMTVVWFCVFNLF